MTTEIIDQVMAVLKFQNPPRWQVPSWQQQQIEAELNCPESKENMMKVMLGMQTQQAPDLGEIDWDKELAIFAPIDYPDYYLQPFHSVLGGWLSELAAVGNRQAMEAILENAHPQKSLGIREAIAQLFPQEARKIVDLGAGIGDDAAAIARHLPQSEVTAIELSPYMIIVGQRLHRDIPNLHWKHGLAESTGIADNSVDAVSMTYLLHECPNPIKELILKECFRVLKPGGMVIVNDGHNESLHSYRGFFEPYKEQWLRFNPEKLLADTGFVNIKSCQVAEPIWTRIGYKA